VLKADESMQIDEIVERLENEVSPSESCGVIELSSRGRSNSFREGSALSAAPGMHASKVA